MNAEQRFAGPFELVGEKPSNLPVATDQPIDQAPIQQPDDITVVARYPEQMQQCQAELLIWCKAKLAATRTETADLLENIEIAKKNHWGTGALERAAKRSQKLELYYDKLARALASGYFIIPNFPVQLFAIRTKRVHPDRKTAANPFNLPIPKTEGPAAGEGRYVNPQTETQGFSQTERSPAGEVVTRNYVVAVGFNEQIDFPFALAKPEVLSATAEAMAVKLFDQMGVLPAQSRNGDPIVVGRILDPRAGSWITFMVAWFVDTRAL